jgi:hypothetical protein
MSASTFIPDRFTFGIVISDTKTLLQVFSIVIENTAKPFKLRPQRSCHRTLIFSSEPIITSAVQVCVEQCPKQQSNQPLGTRGRTPAPEKDD